MLSPQERNSPSNEPAKRQDLSPREIAEAVGAAMYMELTQLRRTLWLIVRQVGPVTVDESKCHPLWRMKATRLTDGQMHLQAIQLPDPTSEQLSQLTEILNGSKTPLDEAMQQTGLKDYPPAYIALLLMPTLQQREDGQWVDAVLMQRPTGQN